MDHDKKRDVRPFEPPPWERDAFEALARRKAGEQEALKILASAQETAGTADTSIAEVLVAEVVAAKPEEAEALPASSLAAPAVDEHRLKAMLMELSKEETADTGHIQLVTRVASMVTAAVGAGMLIGGLITLAGSSQDAAKRTIATTMASGALSVFGLCFVAIAVWVWVRSNHVKGSR